MFRVDKMWQTIREMVSDIGQQYIQARRESFKGHPFASRIRDEPARLLEPLLPSPDLFVSSSPGKGLWTFNPWIAVMNKNETNGPQDGLYVVYLFSSDMRHLYLALAFGVRRLRLAKGIPRMRAIFNAKTAEIVNFYDALPGFIHTPKLDLGTTSGDPQFYSDGTVWYKKYSATNLPDETTMREDLLKLVQFYNKYLEEHNVLTAETDFSETTNVFEGQLKLRSHYVRERNGTIVTEVKEKALLENGKLACEVCGFNFKEEYGDWGDGYIEAHHKIPLSEYGQGLVTRIEDFALLCANCHKMIHRKVNWLTVEKLQQFMRR